MYALVQQYRAGIQKPLEINSLGGEAYQVSGWGEPTLESLNSLLVEQYPELNGESFKIIVRYSFIRRSSGG